MAAGSPVAFFPLQTEGGAGMALTSAYVLVHSSSGSALSAARVIAGIAGVKAAHAVTGVYDVICQVEAQDLDELANTVVDRIQGVEGVERTETALIVQGGVA